LTEHKNIVKYWHSIRVLGFLQVYTGNKDSSIFGIGLKYISRLADSETELKLKIQSSQINHFHIRKARIGTWVDYFIAAQLSTPSILYKSK